MQLKSFQYMLAIAENPTLSKAAEVMYISQPALSQQIKAIENEVGARLFVRKGHSMALTPAGEAFLLCARRILQAYTAMEHEISILNRAEQNTIRMGISPFYSQHYLPKILPDFLTAHSQIKIDIIEDISLNLERKLLDGELDFCMLPLYPKNDLLEYETLFHEEILIALPSSHPLNKHYSESSAALGNYPTLDLALLKNEPFIGLKKIQKFSALGLRLCEEAGFSPNTICETLNWETVHMMIASGLGVGFVPKILIGSIQDEKICPCYYRLPSNVYRVYALVQRPGAVQSREMSLLTESLRKSFVELQSQFPQSRQKTPE